MLSVCNWIMGELVRVYHSLTTTEAQAVVDALAEVRIPIVWTRGSIKRVLNPKLKLQEQILILAACTVPPATAVQLVAWIEYKATKYFMRTLRKLHKDRLLEFDEETGTVQILPPGGIAVQELVRTKNLHSWFKI